VIEQKSQEVAEQESVVARMIDELRKTCVIAPFDGRVVMRHAELGQWLPQGGAVVDLVDLSSALVRVDVHESAIAHVEPGQPAQVFVEALKQSFSGTVKHVIPQADQDARSFPVEVEVPNEDGRLKAGMFAQATVITGLEEEMVAVPKDAVVEFNGAPHVAMVMPNPNPREGGFVAVRVPVTTGADVDDWIAITSGNVYPGMELVVRGTERIMPFPTKVELVDEFGRPAISKPTTGGHGHSRPGEGDRSHGAPADHDSGDEAPHSGDSNDAAHDGSQ
jgi:RND family efflux transporter MFP subunit